MKRAAGVSLVLVLALAVRGAFQLDLQPYPRFEHIGNQIDDQTFFDQWARSIAQGERFAVEHSPHEFATWAARRPGVYPMAPLYPHLIASVYDVFGPAPWRVRALQAVAGVVTVLLVFLLGRRFFGPSVGLLAALGGALYGPWVYYEATYLRATWLTFLAALGLLLSSREHASRSSATLAGLVFGVATTLQEHMLLPALAAAVGVAAANREAARARATCFLLGLAVPVAWVAAVNSWHDGGLAFVSTTGGFNLLIGNLHDASGRGYELSPTYWTLKDRVLAGELGVWRALANDVAQNPADFLGLMTRKIGVFFGGAEYPNNVSYDLARTCNVMLRAAPLGAYVVLPLALVGVVVAVATRQRVLPLLLFLSSYSAAVLVALPLSRVRQPVMVVGLVFAARAVVWFWRLWRQRCFVPVALIASFAIACSVALRPAPLSLVRPVDYQMAAAAYVTRAMEVEREGRRDDAWRLYVRALTLNPHHDAALAGATRVPPTTYGGEKQTLTAESARLCDEAMRSAKAGEYDDAVSKLEQARRESPRAARPAHYLGNVALLRGRLEHAEAWLETAVELDPLDPLPRLALAHLRGLADQRR
jgi:4-amino-4-deoxy-L-arabinose transferase-like glycosyltransferase